MEAHNPTFITEGKAPPEELVEDDLADLQALVSGVTQTSQSTLLLKKRKQMREVDDALEFMKEEFDTRMAECDRSQMEFERKQVDMKRMVAQFEKFIMENDAKQRRAEIKAKTEAEQREKLEAEIKELKKQERELQASTKTLRENLGRVRKYEEYLDAVVRTANDEYEEIGDVVNRHATLQHANDDLAEQADENNDSIEKKRLALVQLRQEQQNKILVMNGVVQSSQKLIESLRANCAQLDIEKESKERFTKQRTMEYGAVVMSIKNLYNRCQNSFVTTRPAVIREKGVAPLKYLESCLEAMERRITSLQETEDGYPAWMADRQAGAGAGAAEETRDARTPVRPPTAERRRGAAGAGRTRAAAHRGRGSTSSRGSSNTSALGFRPEDSSGSRRRGHGSSKRRGSDASSLE